MCEIPPQPTHRDGRFGSGSLLIRGRCQRPSTTTVQVRTPIPLTLSRYKVATGEEQLSGLACISRASADGNSYPLSSSRLSFECHPGLLCSNPFSQRVVVVVAVILTLLFFCVNYESCCFRDLPCIFFSAVVLVALAFVQQTWTPTEHNGV